MRVLAIGFLVLITAQSPAADTPKSPANLVKNPLFSEAGDDKKQPAHYTITGDAAWTDTGFHEFAFRGVALYSGKDLNGDAQLEGSVAQDVTGFDAKSPRWYRFTFRGLPEADFAVKNDDLLMKVDFFGGKKGQSLDGVVRKIYPLIERDRHDLDVNGDGHKNGASVWKTYALEFKLPFPEVDRVRLSAAFRNGAAKKPEKSAFFITEFSLIAISDPVERPKPVAGKAAPTPEGIVPIGGHWYYLPEKGEKIEGLHFTTENADRLFYRESRMTNPFAENMSAWMRKGYKDLSGKVVQEDRFVPDNVVVYFDGKSMVVKAKNLPNHATSQFPERGGMGGNPSYIQEHDYTYYLPLEPKKNPKAIAMTRNNSNRALPMGAIGIAINGVVFYNPFDAGMQDAHDIMDRCCGHPSPDNRYHYHKYPVCVKSPWIDEGEDHSPLIGWAFDGFPIYGPYEKKGVMAKDCEENPLNEFNLHYDEVHGWHYHVTPGKFPYVIGGFWGEVDTRNMRGQGGPPMGDREGGPKKEGPGRAPRPSALPPHVMDQLELTDAQKLEIEQLDKMIREKFEELLTPEQRERLKNAPGGPPRKE